jgi:predicted nucleic acid-binding protein
VILADTSIWIDHFRLPLAQMHDLLNRNEIAMHPFVATELALRSLRSRANTLADLDILPRCLVAQHSEVRHMIETHNLYSKGIGVVDAHLIASCLLSPGTHLWTRDTALERVAKTLGVLADLA